MFRGAPFALLLTAGPALAQEPAHAKLYTRTADGVVRVAIAIELEGAWHIYHSELGHPKAVGQPTVVTFQGEGITWSPVRFPEPVRLDQSDVAGAGTFILAHEHELVLYAAGTLAEGASAEEISAKIKALVCEDVQGCVPFRVTLKSAGAGDDELFAAFPADLVAPLGGGQRVESGGTEAALGELAIPALEPASGQAPREDEIAKGEADTSLYVRFEGDEVRAALEIAIPPGWHLYHEELGPSPYGKPTEITLHGAGVTWEAPAWPEPQRFDQSKIEEGLYILGHEGTIVVYLRGTLEPGASAPEIWGEIEGQTCEELCVDYEEVFVSRGRGTDAVWAAWDGQHARRGAGPSAPGSLEEKSLLAFLLLAVLGGLFALVMPCTYPMIPITISFFTKQAEKRGGNALSLSLAYGAGIVLIFILIGVVFGSLIIPFATHPVTNLVIGIAFVYFSFVLFGMINLQPPAWLMNVAGTASTKGGYVGVFLMGATLVVTSFTCTAPFVGSLLSFGASEGNLVRVALGMAVFGLTMAIPFVFLSLVPARIKAMPRSGEWMNTVKVFMGFVELAAALKFFSNSDLVWGWELFSRELFLLLWGLIFVAAALYLFGAFGRGGKIGRRRLVGASLTLLLALYCFWGMSGRKLDFVMTAIAPNYSGGRLGWDWYTPGGSWTIVKDDYDAARKRAEAEGKLLFINFTGFT
jgi:DsbC/DsbD-like thiol-disulfide interchange protein